MTYSPPPAFQATHLWQAVYTRLEQTKTLLATGGTTTTIIDTTLSADYGDTDSFKNWIAFVAYDAGGAGAAPEGEYQRVSSYAASTTTITVASAYTVAPAAGDIIILARTTPFAFQDVRQWCNNALRKLCDVPDVDTSITTAANQTEHSVPTGVPWNPKRIVKLEIQGRTDDANDNQYAPIPRANWYVVPPTTIGGTATLVIPQYSSGYTVRITFLAPHTPLVNYYDDISKVIHPDLAIAACTLECAQARTATLSKEKMASFYDDYQRAWRDNPITRFIPSLYGMPHWSVSEAEDIVPDPINYGV